MAEDTRKGWFATLRDGVRRQFEEERRYFEAPKVETRYSVGQVITTRAADGTLRTSKVVEVEPQRVFTGLGYRQNTAVKVLDAGEKAPRMASHRELATAVTYRSNTGSLAAAPQQAVQPYVAFKPPHTPGYSAEQQHRIWQGLTVRPPEKGIHV